MSHRIHTVVDRLARYGYATRGVIFVFVGAITFRSALFRSEPIRDAGGSLRIIEAEPFGNLVLGVIAIGLTGYVLWRFVQAATLPVAQPSGSARHLRRLAYASSGLFYGLLAFTAFELAIGFSAGAGSKEQWSARLLTAPLGSTVLLATGIGLCIGGLHTVYRGLFLRFMNLYDEQRAPSKLEWLLKGVGAFGLVAMGMILSAAGGFVVKAAWQEDAYRIRDLGGVLRTLAGTSHGTILLTTAGVGLVVYGTHCLLLGAFRLTRRTA